MALFDNSDYMPNKSGNCQNERVSDVTLQEMVKENLRTPLSETWHSVLTELQQRRAVETTGNLPGGAYVVSTRESLIEEAQTLFNRILEQMDPTSSRSVQLRDWLRRSTPRLADETSAEPVAWMTEETPPRVASAWSREGMHEPMKKVFCVPLYRRSPEEPEPRICPNSLKGHAGDKCPRCGDGPCALLAEQRCKHGVWKGDHCYKCASENGTDKHG